MLQLMIPHHQASIPMAEAALEGSDNPSVERLASAIVASQSSEVEVMQNLLAERGVESPSTPADAPAHDHGGDAAADHDHG